MSHGTHAHGAAAHGARPLPVSAGTTFGVKVMLIGGVVLSIMQGFFVAESSAFGRVWPAADVAKIQLPPSHF